MQTDNEDGPQTLPHRRRGRQTSHGRARGRRPRWGTLSSLGLRRPGTSGSPTDCPPPAPRLERPHAPPPCPPWVPRRAAASQRVRSLLSPPPPTQNGAQRIQDNNEATEVPTNAWTDTRSCGPGGGQLRHRPNTQGRGGPGCWSPAPPQPAGLRARKAEPGQQRGWRAGGWRRVIAQPSRRRPVLPGEGCSHLRNSVWPAWW